MIDNKLLIFTISNYFIGLTLYRLLIIHNYLQGFGLFLAPFIWLGLSISVLNLISALVGKTNNTNRKIINEKPLFNLILLFINAIFPFVALLRLDYYESLKANIHLSFFSPALF